ncbi:hypothetical protein Poli38472_012354 [Pythium oligandrum]|uniref:Uncharacterized protein n=1 Tax=Pythium oligandrum TaxID=41045 RepID=A0A8K1CRZ1_PYTOL|nr:hypothetical protein Poli38472_012354 [Pythium oligandrum]|eukprot:TMW67238.1 hypothetical protein Poli38472_012354 [Pythium oligandrum]
MEDTSFTALLYGDRVPMEAEMTMISPVNASTSTQGMTTSESEDDPMSVDDRELKKTTKPTYYARKDEIQMLQAEAGELTQHLEQLQQKANLLAQFGNMDEALLQNMLLRDGLKQTDLMLAGAQSILANYRVKHARNPLGMCIRLSADPTQRHQTLAALREDRFRDAMDFILERVRYLDLRLPQRDSESFELHNGEHVLLQFEVEPCRTSMSVKQVFDGVMAAVTQQEFTTWEDLGITTTFESDEAEDYSYSQTRGISTALDGAEVEKNLAWFRMYSDGTENLSVPHGLSVMHSIAEDELYPYNPHLRVRHDMSMVILVCALPEYAGLAIIRWAYVLTPKPQCNITRLQELRVRDATARWYEIVRNHVLEFVFAGTSQT